MFILLWNPLSHIPFTERNAVRRSTAMDARPRTSAVVSSRLAVVPFRLRRGIRSSAARPRPPSSPSSSVKPLILSRGDSIEQQRSLDSIGGFPIVNQGTDKNSTDALTTRPESDEVRIPLYTSPDSIEKNNERRGNWIMRILELRSLWKGRRKSVPEEASDEEASEGIASKNVNGKNPDSSMGSCDNCSCISAESNSPVLEYPRIEVKHDKESFSKFLRPVSLSETRFLARLSYLANMAYTIRDIKPGDLWKNHGLRFITSSLRKREAYSLSRKELQANDVSENSHSNGSDSKRRMSINPAFAYHVAATAASYLHSQTKYLLSFKSTHGNESGAIDENQATQNGSSGEPAVGTGVDSTDNQNCATLKNSNSGPSEIAPVCELSSSKEFEDCLALQDLSNSEVASLFATSSMTAVVAAEEETKKAVANDLQSIHYSPCQWFICDDNSNRTRYIVIQGSDSLASWQANLFFEPIQFEGFDVLVHRGIYEAAKGIYEQILPEIRCYIKDHGNASRFLFTGHSLGGSLSVLVNLMLLIRGELPPSSLLPVVTFGSPCIMCGGDQLLEQLGLSISHVQSVMMHRDIVPRAFSCHYPARVADILKRINSNFRNHPCLDTQGLLYGPMGQLLILQPDERVSPPHDLLPSGCGLYVLGAFASSDRGSEPSMSVKVRAAQLEFLNSPHPLEILSDPGAYGVRGSICRDHESENYHRALTHVLRQELRQLRRTDRQKRKELWWTLVSAKEHPSAFVERSSRVTIARAHKRDWLF